MHKCVYITLGTGHRYNQSFKLQCPHSSCSYDSYRTCSINKISIITTSPLVFRGPFSFCGTSRHLIIDISFLGSYTRLPYRCIIKTTKWPKWGQWPFFLLANLLYGLVCAYISDAISWFQRPKTKQDRFPAPVGRLHIRPMKSSHL